MVELVREGTRVGIDGEDADPGATQALRNLEAAGEPLPRAML